MSDMLAKAQKMSKPNDFGARWSQDMCLHELVEAQVAVSGDSDAVVFEQSRLSLAELNTRANRLAHYLRALGVGPDGPVAICLDRSPEMIIGILAILKAGGAYLPIDPTYPPDRIAYILSDAAPGAVLTYPGSDDHLNAAIALLEKRPTVLCLVRDTEGWHDRPETNLPVDQLALTPRHLCYIMYTSGSTGVPKGVMLEHRGVVNRLLWAQAEFPIGRGDCWLQKTPFGFDVSVTEILWPLMTGSKLVLCRPGGHKDPVYLARILASEGITHVHFVPSMLQAFMSANPAIQLPDLKYLFCSGEALGKQIADCTHQALNHVHLVNLYGPTEASVDVTFWRYNAQDAEAYVTPPIGVPIANVQIHILNKDGSPVPPGQPGEIHIGGIAVARGYLNKPEQTALRFISSRLLPNDFLFRTGDLGRRLDDGNIEFLGRNDAQLKLRGFRIELGEIENVLVTHPDVASAIIVPRPNDKGDVHLVAYYRPRPTAPSRIDPNDLARHLANVLPDYMLPVAFVALADLPVTENGKLDKAQLPAPPRDSFLFVPFESPASPMEKRVAAIWSDALRLHPIGRNDNFFSLGGDSLLAMETIIAAQTILGLELELADIFEYPTLVQHANHLDALTSILSAG